MSMTEMEGEGVEMDCALDWWSHCVCWQGGSKISRYMCIHTRVHVPQPHFRSTHFLHAWEEDIPSHTSV